MKGYTAIIYGQSSSGKTYNALQLPGKKILLSSDSSYNYALTQAKDVEVLDVTRWLKDKDGKELCFAEQFDAAVAKKPDHIIIDNISDLVDMAVLELKSSSQASSDPRRDYLITYEGIKRLARKANLVGCNVLFTAWDRADERVAPTGEVFTHYEPMIPAKILNSVCGLANMVGYVQSGEVNGKRVWYYNLSGTQNLLAKDQIWNRPSCYPQQLFTPPAAPKPADKPRTQQAQKPADKQTATEQGAQK